MSSTAFEYEGEDQEVDEMEADVSEDEAVDEDEAEDQEDEAIIGEMIEDEAVDEDEAEPGEDEAVDEDEAVGVSATARLQAQNRQSSWARMLANDQKKDAARAAAARRQITGRIRSIQVGGPAKVASVGSLQGAGVVTAILPNGRRSRMRIIPTLAPVSEVNRLRSVVVTNGKRQALATRTNSKAIANLAAAQAAAVKKITDAQVKSDKDLSKRIVEGDNRLDRRITKELSGGSGLFEKHKKGLVRQLRRQRQRSLMNSVLLASSAPFFVAYGDRESPFAKNNLILSGSLLGFMVADEALDWASPKPGMAQNIAQWWSYLAPIGNGLLVYWLLGDKQHERFIVGIDNIDATGQAKIDLTKDNRIKKGSLEDFKSNSHVVVATLTSDTAGAPFSGEALSATIDKDGMLTISLSNSGVSVPTGTKVAWIVDTKAESNKT